MKSFFTNKVTRIVAFVCWILSTVVLCLGGVTESELSTVLKAVLGIVSAISALVIIVMDIINKKETEKKIAELESK